MQPSSLSTRCSLVLRALTIALVAAALLLVTVHSIATGADNKNKVTGMVVAAPPPAQGFLGEWQLRQSGQLVKVVVTRDTIVDGDFGGILPKIGEWVEAKGKPQADGTLLARMFRPSNLRSGEIVARLTATAVLTQVAQLYQLTLLDSLLADANIYRFAIDSEADEKAFALRLAADTRNFAWAEVNYIDGVPRFVEGNPYRTWKWGSSEPEGYVNQNAYGQVNLAPVAGRYEGDGVIVAVLDTGIDATHPVFQERLLPGRDLVDNDDLPQDGPAPGQPAGFSVGHGTHVSGIIARIAPKSKILPVRVLDVDGRGDTYTLAYAVEWAVDNGAGVINLSLGCDFDSTALNDAIAYAQSAGVIVVAAAGNDDDETPQYPAAYPGVLAVTAVDEAGLKAPFANYGADWIALAAPGVGITSTVPVSGTILYGTWSGTSMATPFGSGAAALARQHSPDAAPAAIVDMLTAAGGSLDATNPAYAGKLGHLLDIGTALLGPPAPTPEATAGSTLEATPEATPEMTPDIPPDVTPEVPPDVTPDVPPGVIPKPTAAPTRQPVLEPAPTPVPDNLPEKLYLPAVFN